VPVAFTNGSPIQVADTRDGNKLVRSDESQVRIDLSFKYLTFVGHSLGNVTCH